LNFLSLEKCGQNQFAQYDSTDFIIRKRNGETAVIEDTPDEVKRTKCTILLKLQKVQTDLTLRRGRIDG
jgi:hypothetical protein